MKRIFILTALILFLTACGTAQEDLNVTAPQPLQTIQVGNPVAAAPATSAAPAPSEPAAVTALEPATNENAPFADQQAFVQFMFDELTSLESTLVLLDANLSEALNSDAPDSLLALRDFMISGVRNDQARIEQAAPYNAAVANLHDYVVQAFHFSMEQKAAEYEIFSTESLEERSVLLAANSQNEQQAAYYLSLAWEELSNLSDTPIYQK